MKPILTHETDGGLAALSDDPLGFVLLEAQSLRDFGDTDDIRNELRSAATITVTVSVSDKPISFDGDIE